MSDHPVPASAGDWYLHFFTPLVNEFWRRVAPPADDDVAFIGRRLRLRPGARILDERAKRVVAVTIEYSESVLQLQAFSAPKTTGLWHRVRGEIAQQFTSQGARVQEESGDFGPELAIVTPVPAEQGGGRDH